MPEHVPGRDCGECTVCCVALKIDDPALQKEAGISCVHKIEHGGCGIYENRPQTCRAWFCGWRYAAQLSDDWRPDRCGVLLSFMKCEEPGYPDAAIKLSTQDPEAALQDVVLDFIAQNLRNGLPLYFVFTAGPGSGFKTFLNARLKASLATGDRAKLAEAMAGVMAEQSQLNAAEKAR